MITELEIFAKESNRSNQILLKRSQIWFSKKNRHWFASFFIVSLRRSFLENWISGLTGISTFFYKICCNVNRRFCKQQFLHLSSFLWKAWTLAHPISQQKLNRIFVIGGAISNIWDFCWDAFRCSKLKRHINYSSSIINTTITLQMNC